MDMNPNDPRVQQLLAQLRAQGGGITGTGGPLPPGAGQMPAQMQGPPPVAGQAPMQGPAMVAPQGVAMAPGGAGMPPGGMAPPGGPVGAPNGMPGGAPPVGGGQLDPAMVEQVLAMQGQAGQRAGLDRQYKLADALRADSKSQLQGRTVPSSTGGIYVAPSWLNGLASVAGSYAANKQQGAADTTGAGLDSQRQSAQRGYFDAITGQKKKKPDQQANWTEDTLRGE